MAKRKRSTRRSPKAYVGDRVLCLYTLLSCCCLPSWVGATSRRDPELPVNESLRKLLADKRISGFLDRPDAELMFAIPVGLMLVGWIVLLVGLWRSRSWALWVMLLLHAPGAAYSAWARDWISAIPAAAIVIYCGLRVSRKVG